VKKSTSAAYKPGDRVVAIPEGDQGLAEFFLARASKAVRLPEGLSERGAGCLIQPLATVIHALDRLGSVEGKSAAVVGLGPMGLLLCWLLGQRGAGRIVGIDPIEQRCRIAVEFGARQVFATRSVEVVHASRQQGAEWLPPDLCIEAVGHQVDTLNDCLELVRKNGSVLAFGVPDQPVYALEYETFFRKNLLLQAVVTPDWGVYLPRARDLFLAHQEELGKMVTHHFSIGDAARAFSLYEHHEDGILKAVLDASAWQDVD
jgi:threonine dehydrogenase-like Zn-dependent dehydrogenase